MHRRQMTMAFAFLVVVGCSSPLGDNDSAIDQAGRRAMEAQMTAIVEPPGAPCPPDERTWYTIQKQARERIAAAYADPEKSRLLGLLLRDGNRQACALAGGVDSYRPGRQSVTGGSAQLDAEVGIWSRFRAPSQPGTLEPHNIQECTFELVRSGPTWLVAGVRCSFVPGHGP